LRARRTAWCIGPKVEPQPTIASLPLVSPSSSSLYAETLAPALDFGWSDLRAWRDGRYKYVRPDT